MTFEERQVFDWKHRWQEIIPVYNKPLLKYTSIDYIKAKKAIVCDCDGVITDGTSTIGYYDGKIQKISKTYGSYDKEAIQFMVALGWDITFVTSDKLGHDLTYERLRTWSDKISLRLSDWKQRKETIDFIGRYDNASYISFIGDSVSDLYTLESEYLDSFYCPGNASPIVKNDKRVNSEVTLIGGHGALAEILYKIHADVKNGLKLNNYRIDPSRKFLLEA